MCESIRTQTTSNFISTFFRVTSSPPPPVHVVNRYVREESVPIKKTDKAAEDGYVGRLPEVVVGGGGGYGQRRRVRSTGKEGWMKKFALGFRVLEVLFCVVSCREWLRLSKGWRLISYRMDVNVIGFAYSVLQGCIGVLVGYWESWQ
ncbi:hypothetical protein Tco_1327771 [Tanacetum coccineum]